MRQKILKYTIADHKVREFKHFSKWTAAKQMLDSDLEMYYTHHAS